MSSDAPTHLRAEHLVDPLGTTTRVPRLSWWLPGGSAVQGAYEIEVDGEPLGRVESPGSVLVAWPGRPLASRQRVSWRVRVWTDVGESGWSAPATVEAGLCERSDWIAQWIEPGDENRYPPGERPGYFLRHTFALDGVNGDARMYATAHGIYESFLNGRRVGDHELTPGFTAYDKVLQVQTYDVAELLVEGPNVWDVVVSDGWFRGRNGFNQVANCYGSSVAFLGQLEAAPGVVTTGADWEWATGPVVTADLMAGQTEDRGRRAREWAPVITADHAFDALTTSPAPPTRRTEELRPVSVRRLGQGREVIDLGQNINGWIRLADLGPAGTTVTLTHGEALDHDGDVTQDHLAGTNFATGESLTVGMTDRVTSAGVDGAVFEPRHTVHGFRYVRVEGHPGRLTSDDVTGVVVHTDLRRTGWFRCSDDRINRLHDATVWSFRGNACEIPTDCPHRERAGWTGDYQLFLPTAAFLFDVAGFSEKWLRDLRADARPDGCICNVAPDPVRPRALPAENEMWMMLQGSSGWGDAITIVPWELYRAYGDEKILADCWETMVRWVDFAARTAAASRHQSRIDRSPEPAPHEQFVWDGGFHWGEWHEPDQDEGDMEMWSKDKGDVGTAFLHRSALLAARIGRLLGHDSESDRLEQLSADALDAWRREFIGEDGLTPDTQANHVRALAFGLVPEERRDGVAARLVGLIRDAGTHVGTGFLSTPDLLPVLADTGHLDVAYELLFQDTEPSWLYMIDRGATTVWEAWDGIDGDGNPNASLNHYSKGAVVQFLHTHTAGITMLDDAPAYRRFRVAPRPGGGLTWAEAVHDSPHGRIESSWRIVDHDFHLTVTVPPGTTAEVILPDGSRTETGPGRAELSCRVERSA